jgi:hypothetical protein
MQVVVGQPFLGRGDKHILPLVSQEQASGFASHGIDGALDDQLQQFLLSEGCPQRLAHLAKGFEIISRFGH